MFKLFLYCAMLPVGFILSIWSGIRWYKAGFYVAIGNSAVPDDGYWLLFLMIGIAISGYAILEIAYRKNK